MERPTQDDQGDRPYEPDTDELGGHRQTEEEAAYEQASNGEQRDPDAPDD